MARRKKKQFHCNSCGQPCEIYKKSKRHRVLVCPVHGVIAWNPFRLGAGTAGGAAAGAAVGSAVPVIGTAIGAVAGGILGSYEKADDPVPRATGGACQEVVRAFRNSYSTERRVHDALAR